MIEKKKKRGLEQNSKKKKKKGLIILIKIEQFRPSSDHLGWRCINTIDYVNSCEQYYFHIFINLKETKIIILY